MVNAVKALETKWRSQVSQDDIDVWKFPCIAPACELGRCFHACQGVVAVSTADVICVTQHISLSQVLGCAAATTFSTSFTAPALHSTPLPRLQLLLAPDQALDVATDMLSLSLSIIGKPPRPFAQTSNNAAQMPAECAAWATACDVGVQRHDTQLLCLCC